MSIVICGPKTVRETLDLRLQRLSSRVFARNLLFGTCFLANATLLEHAFCAFLFVRENVNLDALGLVCSFSLCFGGWFFVFWDFSHVQVREPPSASVISGRKTVRESVKPKLSTCGSSDENTRFCSKYVPETLHRQASRSSFF